MTALRPLRLAHRPLRHLASGALRRAAVPLALAVLLPSSAAGQPDAAPLASLDASMAAAEAALRAGEPHIAESSYRAALFQAWMARGGLDVAAGRLTESREAFLEASRAVVDADAAFRSLALVQLQLGESAEAIRLLITLSARNPDDLLARRLLFQALMAAGQPEEAVQSLEEARARAPDDPETAFLLASGYLQLKRIDAAERLFDEVVAARPIPQTWVLIGRTYRDFHMYDHARTALKKALTRDPQVRRAHYYLGTIAVMSEGVVRLDDAIAEFRQELEIEPDDPAATLRLAMALVESRREADAIDMLERHVRSNASAPALHYLGRAQLGLDRAAEAAASFRRALELAQASGDTEARIGPIHYQLALALRELGQQAEADRHFEIARAASARRADADREQLDRYLADTQETAAGQIAAIPLDSPFADLPAGSRAELERAVKTVLARTYLNMGVLRAQSEQFARAAELFERGASVDPGFPQLQYSLGVALFNAQQYDKAAAALAQAHAADPASDDTRRMLALAYLNAERYAPAAELLAGDARLESDPSLQYAYGLALARSDRPAEAEAVFTRMLKQHGDRAELHVILGQAHAQQGDFEAAIKSLERARELNPTVPDAGATLGMIYLKQGKLAEAAARLRDELEANPDNLAARHTLATVLDLDGRPDEAVTLLQELLKRRPDYANARYLLGKILLARADTQNAVLHLEAAVRLSPDDATYHYQLAQAYLKTGQRELADKHLARYRELKDQRRDGGLP